MIRKPATSAAITAERPAGLHADRDPQIFAAVLALLPDIGYERMTIDAVAARAHVSKATIYRRWPGKPQMVVDALRHKKFEVSKAPDTGSLRGDLIALLRSITEMCAADMPLMLALSFAMYTNPELARLVREQVLPASRLDSDTIIDRAVARGEIAPGAGARQVFHEIAPALLTSRMVAQGQPIDDAYHNCVVDNVLLPVLTH